MMMLPGLIYLLFNNYLPLFGLTIAFKNIDFSKGIWPATGWDLDTLGLFATRMPGS